MENFIQQALNLPETRVVEVSQIERGHWLIRVESTLKGTTCKKCGREITDFHGLDQTIRLRHLPIFEVPVWIELRPKRYRCRFCQGTPTTSQRLEWYVPRSPNTKAYEAWLLRLLVNSTVADVAATLGIREETVEGVLDRWIAREVDWSAYERLGTIGIDEIALKRGHREFVVLVTAPLESGGVEVLSVLSDRKTHTVSAFLASIPALLRRTIERVCTDMYTGFVEAARE
jgi:transposase